MTAYRLIACDLRTDRVIDVLPVDGLAWDHYIGRTGTARWSITATEPDVAARALRLQPGRTGVWIERSRDVVWGGILWTRRRSSASASAAARLDLQAATWESYLDHRLLMSTLTATQVDQLDIARTLVAYTAQDPGGDLGIVLDYDTTSGVLRDRTYSRYDLQTVRKLLDDLAAVEGGFEWMIRSYRDEYGARTKKLVLGYPRIVAGSTDVVLSYPGQITSYDLPEDGTAMATHWQSRGAATNQNQAAASTPLITSVYDSGLTAQGWPRLDGSSDYTTVERLDTLGAHARADLGRARTPRLIPSVTIRSDGMPLPALGSHVRLRVRDVWHPRGWAARHRVVGLSVTSSTRASGETAQLYLEEVA